MPETDTIEATKKLLNFLSSNRPQSPSLQSTNETVKAASPVISQEDTAALAVPAGPPTDPANIPGGNFMDQFTALTKQALASTESAVNTPPSRVSLQGDLSWFDRNQRKDAQGRTIPIDTETGINLGEFSRAVWQRRPEERLVVLKKMFPNNIVRQADTGEPIVEVNGPGGTKKDVLVNPSGFNAEDFIEGVQQSAGQTAGAIGGMAVGNAIGSRLGPMAATAGRVAGAAIGSGIGGTIEDVMARSAEGVPLNLEEIAKEQTKNATINALWDIGILGATKVPRAVSPFAGTPGQAQFDLQAAKKYFKDQWGIDFQTTPAEKSGSPLLGRLERQESQLPGSANVFGKLYAKGGEQISKIYDAALGMHIPEEDLGKDIIAQAKRKIVQPAEDAVKSARDALVSKGETELVNAIDAVAPTGTVTKEVAGEAARSEFEAARDLAKSRVDAAYATVRSLPGGSGKVLPGDPVANAADQILSEIPVSGGKVLKSSVPESLMSFLQDMQAQRGQLMSLDELTKLKNAAYDEIAKTEAVPDVKDRWFGKIAAAYDNAIDVGTASAGGGLSVAPL